MRTLLAATFVAFVACAGQARATTCTIAYKDGSGTSQTFQGTIGTSGVCVPDSNVASGGADVSATNPLPVSATSHAFSLPIQLTASTSTNYAAGQVIGVSSVNPATSVTTSGALIPLTSAAQNAGGGLHVQTVAVTSNSTLPSLGINVLLCWVQPTHTTFTDHSPFTLALADQPYCLPAPITSTTSYPTTGGILYQHDLNIPFNLLGSATTMYAVLYVASGSANWTLGSATDLSFIVAGDN